MTILRKSLEVTRGTRIPAEPKPDPMKEGNAMLRRWMVGTAAATLTLLMYVAYQDWASLSFGSKVITCLIGCVISTVAFLGAGLFDLGFDE